MEMMTVDMFKELDKQTIIVGVKWKWTDDPVDSIICNLDENSTIEPRFKRVKISTESDLVLNKFEEVKINQEDEKFEVKVEEVKNETNEKKEP